MAKPKQQTEVEVIPVLEEVARIRRRRRVTGRVRVSVQTETVEEQVAAVLRHRRAQIERVPVDREVEEMPSVQQEGDLVIIPVVEERLVLVRRLVVTEEIHLRLTEQEEPVRLAVPLRRQRAEVERLPVANDEYEPEEH
ncbi:MAG TPA: DUF2382 domain-containing protein [Falsiroseomonas sp.]|jgi:stress response protein YsnF|nr:DUF2382 domain-containing protein [Falsiroseomonas sp.]